MTHFVYFSPTGGTRKYIRALLPLVKESQEHDLSVKRDDFLLETSKDDLLVLAFPVYFGRFPSLFLEKLLGLKGKKTPAILLCVYGNRHYDDALLEGSNFLRSKGFTVFAGAALIAKHSYGEIQVHRPHGKDLQEVKDFFAKALTLPQKKVYSFPGNFPYKKMGKPHFFPHTSPDCIGCKACLRACPWQAITEEILTLEAKCGACLACVDVCPMDARVLGEDYAEFAMDFSEKLKEPRENEFFL